MYTLAVVLFTVFALALGAHTLGMMVKAKPKTTAQQTACYIAGRGMTQQQVVRAIYDYQHIQDDMGGLNSRQTATYHGLCAVAGVLPEEL
jgi:hypothetical protein